MRSRRLCFRKDEEVCIYVCICCMQQTHGHDEERQGRRHSRRARKSRSALSDSHWSRPDGRTAHGRARATPKHDKLGVFFLHLGQLEQANKASFFNRFWKNGRSMCAFLPACLLLVLLDLDRLLRWLAWPGVGGRSVPSSSSPASLQLAVFLLLLLAKLCSLSSCADCNGHQSWRARHSGCDLRANELDTAGVLQRSASRSIPSSLIRAIMRGKQHGPLGS